MVNEALTKTAESLPDHFDLENDVAYRIWREEKLNNAPRKVEELLVPISNRQSPTIDETRKIKQLCARANMAVYEGLTGLGPADIRPLAAQFGLTRLDTERLGDKDGVSTIRVIERKKGTGKKGFYIPFSDRPLGWHTDGYYNDGQNQVLGFTLHCARDSAGGDSHMLNHEIAYIRLRDENPDLVAALMLPDAMIIPANELDTDEGRRQQSVGPVFSMPGGNLHMRYTARSREIVWKQDTDVARARTFITDLLASDDEFILRHHLKPGQGMISNNILHKRDGFDDGEAGNDGRLLYRARFIDRVAKDV